MLIKIPSCVWLWTLGFTVVILFFPNLSTNTLNATINANERAINYIDGQIQQIFISKLTGGQEIPFVNTDAMGIALFKESLLKNDTLEYELVLNDIKDITRIYIDFNNTIPLKEIYSNPIIPDICCLSSEASEPENFYLNGIVEDDINITPLDLIKNGIPLQVNNDIPVNTFDINQPTIETLMYNNKSNNLTGLFESGLVFITVETKLQPTGEIRGQIIDKVQILE
jgi:hypothetical protein